MPSSASKAHLISSPGFLHKLGASLVLEATLFAFVAVTPSLREWADEVHAAIELRLLEGAHALAWWWAISMLASSCCVVQLLLSALSVGCSGLNSALGPVRPATLALTGLLQAAAWRVVLLHKPAQAPSVALGSVLTLVLSLLPEVVDLVNRRKEQAARAGKDEQAHAAPVILRLSKLGCSACEMKVREVCEVHPEVLRCVTDIDASTVSLTVRRGADAAAVAGALSAALARAGYMRTPTLGGASATAVTAKPPQWAPLQGVFGRRLLGDGLLGVAGGLLGSSCCAVQLGLGVLASWGVGLTAGCAGFNTYLGPLRPHLRAATVTFFAIRWATAPRVQYRSLLAASLVAVLLTLLPEVLLYSGGPALAPPSSGKAVLRWTVEVGGMGCEACQHAVQGALRRSSGVIEAYADLSSGKATITANPEWGFDWDTLVRTLSGVGFDLNVSSAVQLD